MENNEMNEVNEMNEMNEVKTEMRPGMDAKKAITLGAAYGAAAGAGVIVGIGIGDLFVRGVNRGLHWIAGKLEKKKKPELVQDSKEVK